MTVPSPTSAKTAGSRTQAFLREIIEPTPPSRHPSEGGDYRNSPPLEGWPQAGVGVIF